MGGRKPGNWEAKAKSNMMTIDEKAERRELTAKRQAFTREYPIDNNGEKAAIRAGYSKKTAASQASRLLKIVNVQKAIAERRAEIAERADVELTYIIRGLVDIYNRAIKAGRLADANRALELLGKHKGAFSDRLELSGTVGLLVGKMSASEREAWLREQLALTDEQRAAGAALAIA